MADNAFDVTVCLSCAGVRSPVDADQKYLSYWRLSRMFDGLMVLSFAGTYLTAEDDHWLRVRPRDSGARRVWRCPAAICPAHTASMSHTDPARRP